MPASAPIDRILTIALFGRSASEGAKDAMVIISADANAAHQSVINVMDAARRVGLHQLTFATQGQGTGNAAAAAAANEP